jgi:hypothetical protein
MYVSVPQFNGKDSPVSARESGRAVEQNTVSLRGFHLFVYQCQRAAIKLFKSWLISYDLMPKLSPSYIRESHNYFNQSFVYRYWLK